MKCLWNHAFWDNESLATNHINDHVYHANEANANTLQPQAILKFEMQALYLSLLISFCYLFTCLKSSPYALQVTKMEVLCPWYYIHLVMEDEVNFVNYIIHMLSWSNDAQTAFLFQLVFPLRWKTPVEEEEFSNMLFSSYHAMKYHTPSLTLPPLKNFKSLRVNIHGLPLISKACTLPSCFYLKKYYDLPCYLHFSKYVLSYHWELKYWTVAIKHEMRKCQKSENFSPRDTPQQPTTLPKSKESVCPHLLLYVACGFRTGIGWNVYGGNIIERCGFARMRSC